MYLHTLVMHDIFASCIVNLAHAKMKIYSASVKYIGIGFEVLFWEPVKPYFYIHLEIFQNFNRI